MLFCKTLLLLLRRDTDKYRDRFCGIVRFKGRQSINSVKDVITEINNRCNAKMYVCIASNESFKS